MKKIQTILGEITVDESKDKETTEHKNKKTIIRLLRIFVKNSLR